MESKEETKMWVQAWTFLLKHSDRVLEWTLQHLYIILVANACAVVIGVLVGIFISGKGRERLADIVLYLASIMMTVPSLALYGILMGILSALTLPSIGFLPVVIALTLYGLLPIVRNTHTAIREVDPAIIEAGRGMGMSEFQILVKVKLPLAVPVIMAGLRQAIVMNIGVAAIGSYIGAGGLGQPIFRGIANYRTDLILIGAICVSLLAIIVDIIMGRLEWLTTPKGVRIRSKQ
jgi:osmoprotectant transport system permease protein